MTEDNILGLVAFNALSVPGAGLATRVRAHVELMTEMSANNSVELARDAFEEICHKPR